MVNKTKPRLRLAVMPLDSLLKNLCGREHQGEAAGENITSAVTNTNQIQDGLDFVKLKH